MGLILNKFSDKYKVLSKVYANRKLKRCLNEFKKGDQLAVLETIISRVYTQKRPIITIMDSLNKKDFKHIPEDIFDIIRSFCHGFCGDSLLSLTLHEVSEKMFVAKTLVRNYYMISRLAIDPHFCNHKELVTCANWTRLQFQKLDISFQSEEESDDDEDDESTGSVIIYN